MGLIVVCDASPVRAVHHLGLMPLFETLYGTVVIPEAVRAELMRPTSTCPTIDIRAYASFRISDPSGSAASLGIPPDLDAGETAAIALALELRADLLLIDERKGTHAARQLGLKTVGVLGVLLDAKTKGYVAAVMPLVDRLTAELRFYVSPGLRARLAATAAE